MLDLAIMAARSALATTRIPLTRAVGYEPEGESDAMEQDQGISSLVKGGKAGKDAVDFELVDGDADGGSRLAGWQDLPVGLTINMVSLAWPGRTEEAFARGATVELVVDHAR